MTTSPWAGRILWLPGAMVYAGPLGPTTPHQHHALQVILAPDGVDVAGSDRVPRRFTAALLPADTEHTIVSGVVDGRLLWLDPDSAYHQRLAPRLRGSATTVVSLEDPEPGTLRAFFSRPLSAAWVEELVARWGGGAAPRVQHPGVRRVQQAVAERLDGGPLDLASLATVARLSEGRLAHVFREQVGLPIRPYILWLRLQRAMQSLRRGRPLSEAAHEAGFADGPHLSRTFRRMVGLAPSDLAGWVEWMVPDEGPRRS